MNKLDQSKTQLRETTTDELEVVSGGYGMVLSMAYWALQGKPQGPDPQAYYSPNCVNNTCYPR